MGISPLEPATMHVEQIFQGGLWLLSALIAWACIRSGQMALHKAWMMRSYAFTLIFVAEPRAGRLGLRPTPTRASSDLLWALVVVAAISPELILTATVASPHPQGEGQARPDRSSVSDRR